MAAYELLLLNTAIPQIQAAQSGDTYVVPRDIAFSTVANLANGTNLLPSLTFSSDTNTGIYREGADALGFTAGGGTNQMVLTSTGLGIGTSSPLTKLEVNDYVNTSYTELVAFTGAKGAFVGIPTNQLSIVDSTAQAAGVGGEIVFEGKFDSSNITCFASVGGVKENSTSSDYGGAFVVRTRVNGGNLTERARITSGGNLDLQKNIGLGGASATTSGTGITFPATQSSSTDANTLDDYEEGTWTPAVRGAVTAGTYELATAEGSYVRIGKQVTLSCRIVFAAAITGGGTTYLQITGAPSFNNAAAAYGPVSQSGLDMTTNYTWLTVSFINSSGTTILYLEENGDSVSSSDFPISGVSANDSIRFSITYIST